MHGKHMEQSLELKKEGQLGLGTEGIQVAPCQFGQMWEMIVEISSIVTLTSFELGEDSFQKVNWAKMKGCWAGKNQRCWIYLSQLIKVTLKIFLRIPEPKSFKPPRDICLKNYRVHARFPEVMSQVGPGILLASHESLECSVVIKNTN